MMQTIEIQKKKIKAQFFAEVEFGILSKDCVNYGICRITTMSEKGLCKKCNHSTAIITVFDENHVEFNFLKHSITTATYKKYFSRKIFIVNECYINQEKEGNEGVKFKIKKGKYTVSEDASFFKIKFFDVSNSFFA